MQDGAPAAMLERLAGADAEFAGLQAAIAADPGDADALFKLAVLLHRAGRTREARETLTKLAAVYEQRGQRSQAVRIRQMLGTAKTTPVAQEEPPPRPKRTNVLRRTDTLRQHRVGTGCHLNRLLEAAELGVHEDELVRPGGQRRRAEIGARAELAVVDEDLGRRLHAQAQRAGQRGRRRLGQGKRR